MLHYYSLRCRMNNIFIYLQSRLCCLKKKHYLPKLSPITFLGLAGAADAAYIYEEKFSIKDLQRDLYNMASKMCAGVQRGLILRNEKCNERYNCDFMTRLYAEEGKGVFSARSNIIGMEIALSISYLSYLNNCIA